jgi:hypothetical protein
MRTIGFLLVLTAACVSGACQRPATGPVRVVRVPDGGVQPEVAVDTAGTVHLVYLSGPPARADVFYAHSNDGGRSWSAPVRVNSVPGSAIATGTVRGARIALGRGGRVHVAWNGATESGPPAPGASASAPPGAPMWYARSTGDGQFEPQRDLRTMTTDVDGGGALASAGNGTVYVAWHARDVREPAGEAHRRVWIAQSPDDGQTFAAERPVSDPATGVCGCCALALAAGTDGRMHLLYRAATDGVHRDIHALISRDGGTRFDDEVFGRWEIAACPMTTAAIVTTPGVRYAWETDGQVHARDDAGHTFTPPIPDGQSAGALRRKHPRIAVGLDGSTLLAWTEGTSWAKGGRVAWQVFDAAGAPTGERGSVDGLQPWGLAAAASSAGGYTVVY